MKLRASSLKRETKWTNLQLDTPRKKKKRKHKIRNERRDVMNDNTEI